MSNNYVLTNNLSATVNPSVAYCNSWIPVENNAGRPLYANASYITNLDNLSISLSSSNLDIGSVHVIDKDSGLAATIADVGIGVGALRVLSQDLESSIDDITIGDRNGNFAYVTNSALNVFTTNGISAVSVINFPTQLTAVSVTNLDTYVNSITSLQVIANTLLNSLTATNQVNNSIRYSIDSFNLFGTNGFEFKNVERPFFALRVTPNTTRRIILDEYALINTDTAHICGYRWYTNPTLSVTPTWTNLTPYIQYAFLPEDNTPSTISGALSSVRHSGLFSSRNADSDSALKDIVLTDGATPTILVLSLQHINAATAAGAFLTVNVTDLG
jgi:hypothetical protein